MRSKRIDSSRAALSSQHLPHAPYYECDQSGILIHQSKSRLHPFLLGLLVAKSHNGQHQKGWNPCLAESHEASIPEADDLIRALLELCLDEAK